MKHKFFKRLLLAVVVLFGFSGFAHAIKVKFAFTEQSGYQVSLVTTITTIGFDGGVTTTTTVNDIQPNKSVSIKSVYDYENMADKVEGGITTSYVSEITGNAVTITATETDGTGNVSVYTSAISYRYSLSLQYYYEEVRSTDISDLIQKDATINVGDLFGELQAYSLTVKIVNTDGKTDTGDDLEVYVESTDGFSKWYTPKNGKVTIGLKEGTYTIGVNNYVSKTIEVKEDKTITLKVPKMISFNVTVDGKPIYEWVRDLYEESNKPFYLRMIDYKNVSYWNSEGKYYARLDPEQSYRLRCSYFGHDASDDDFVKGTTKIADGGTIRIGTFNVESEGNGLVFPRDEFSGSGSYKLFVGNPIRLAAIPVGKAEFVSWTVNGKEYTEPLIDFTVKDDINTATAKFSGEIVNHIKPAGSSIGQINVRIEGDYLILPSDTEGAACIYATDGRLVKRTGVIGDHLCIGDLPSGAYVLALTANGQRWNAQFVKP